MMGPKNDSLWVASHKSYKPLDAKAIGKVGWVLLDLNISQLCMGSGKGKSLQTRYYSVKILTDGRWKLEGHSPRLLMYDVKLSVSERLRLQVVSKASKTPHAYMTGTVNDKISSTKHEEHYQVIESLLERGGRYLCYDPYKVDGFVLSETEKLPKSTSHANLISIDRVAVAYAYETGIIALVE